MFHACPFHFDDALGASIVASSAMDAKIIIHRDFSPFSDVLGFFWHPKASRWADLQASLATHGITQSEAIATQDDLALGWLLDRLGELDVTARGMVEASFHVILHEFHEIAEKKGWQCTACDEIIWSRVEFE